MAFEPFYRRHVDAVTRFMAYLAKPGSPVRPCVLVDEGGSDKEHADEMAGRPRPLETAG